MILVASLICIAAIAGFLLGAIYEKAEQAGERRKDQDRIAILRGLIAERGLRYDDRSN